MKITTDVNSAGLRTAGNVLPRLSNDAENRTIHSDVSFSNDVIIKMQRERSTIDALTIAQMSRELVQKAMNVSSRLMSIASEAMRTGRVDINEMNSQISNIQGSMSNYGEKVSVPVSNSVPVTDDFRMKMDRSLVTLREAATDIAAGRPVKADVFETVTKGLKQVASELDSRIKVYASEFRNVKSVESTGINYAVLNRNTAEIISHNPVRALVSQGNINNEIAGKLTIT